MSAQVGGAGEEGLPPNYHDDHAIPGYEQFAAPPPQAPGFKGKLKGFLKKETPLEKEMRRLNKEEQKRQQAIHIAEAQRKLNEAYTSLSGQSPLAASYLMGGMNNTNTNRTT